MNKSATLSSAQVPFWTENPNVFLDPKYVTEWCPVPTAMSFAQQLNALTRLLVLVAIALFAWTRESRILVISGITVGAVAMYYIYFRDRNGRRDRRRGGAAAAASQMHREEFSSNGGSGSGSGSGSGKSEESMRVFPQRGGGGGDDGDAENLPGMMFDTPSSQNPFANVLVTDYGENPHKKPAPFCTGGNGGNGDGSSRDTILEEAKQLVLENNPGQPDLAENCSRIWATSSSSSSRCARSTRPHPPPSRTTKRDSRNSATETWYLAKRETCLPAREISPTPFCDPHIHGSSSLPFSSFLFSSFLLFIFSSFLFFLSCFAGRFVTRCAPSSRIGIDRCLCVYASTCLRVCIIMNDFQNHLAQPSLRPSVRPRKFFLLL